MGLFFKISPRKWSLILQYTSNHIMFLNRCRYFHKNMSSKCQCFDSREYCDGIIGVLFDRTRVRDKDYIELEYEYTQLIEIWIINERPGAHFTNDYSFVIQIRWKFHSTLIQVIGKWSLWKFAHVTTALLSYHVQNVVAIWYPTMDFY